MAAKRHTGKKRQAAKKPPPPLVNPLPGLNLFTAKVVRGSGRAPLVELAAGDKLWVATSDGGATQVNYRRDWAADLESLRALLERMACEAYVRGYNKGHRGGARAKPKGRKGKT